MALEEGRVTANGVDFAYLACGSGPLALCLHGFPDSAHTWRHLLPMLAEAGFRAVAPFMRGYAPSSVPPDGRYQTGVLAADALALHDALGAEQQAVIIGHDWGAVATFYGHGAADGCIGLEVAKGAAADIPAEGSEVAIFDGLGHFLHLEDLEHDDVNRRIVEFVSS